MRLAIYVSDITWMLFFPLYDVPILLDVWKSNVVMCKIVESKMLLILVSCSCWFVSTLFWSVVAVNSFVPFRCLFHFCGRVISFVFSEPLKRLSLCIYWVCVIYLSVLRFYNISKNSKIERILLRKYYHLMAVSMFLPALIFQVS